ncbi:MAG: hypothetical protein J6Y94_03090, partial [Bacteriovoracaceae bacterium]|nr:hypothetical protein [Bacteriovoracaceae bacterium]
MTQEEEVPRKKFAWWPNVTLLVVLGGATGVLHWQHHAAQYWQNLLDGTAICFQRVEQTYTARMLGNRGATYLKAPFLQRTQACWTDLMAAMGALEKDVASQSYQGLMQTLAKDGHWFLERIQNNSESTLLRQDLHQRFHKLDVLKNDLVDALAAQAQRNQIFWYVAWAAIFGSSFFLARGVYRTYRALRRQRQLWQGIDLDAAEELKSGAPWPVLKIERLMHQVLNALPLGKLEQLWSSFFADWAAGKVDLRQCTAARLALPPAQLDWYEALPAANE